MHILWEVSGLGSSGKDSDQWWALANTVMGFLYIFLTVHLRIILVGKQLDAQFLL